MRGLWHPATEDIELAQVMHALSDPVRLRMLTRIAAHDGVGCTEVINDTGLHKSTISHHLRVLREAGVTQTEVDGRARLVRLRRADLDARFPGLLDAVLGALDHAPAATSGAG